MDKETYLNIRKKIKFQSHKFMLLKHILVDALIISSVIIWSGIFRNSALQCFSALGVFTLIFRSFALMHEAVHGQAIKSVLNDWIGIFFGGIAFLSYEPWRLIHLEHHYWAGNVEKDPVMAILIAYPKAPKYVQVILNFGWKSWLPIMAISQHLVFWIRSVQKIKSSRYSKKLMASIIWPICFWSLILFSLPLKVLMFTLLPGVFLYLIAVEIVNLPHHLRLPQGKGITRLPVWEQNQCSRSCIYLRWIEKYITLNFNYHTEHHLFPDLPWHELSSAHQILKENLGEKLNTDTQFIWTIKHRSQSLEFVLETNNLCAETFELQMQDDFRERQVG